MPSRRYIHTLCVRRQTETPFRGYIHTLELLKKQETTNNKETRNSVPDSARYRPAWSF